MEVFKSGGKAIYAFRSYRRAYNKETRTYDNECRIVDTVVDIVKVGSSYVHALCRTPCGFEKRIINKKDLRPCLD